jgi:hypothetical protein
MSTNTNGKMPSYKRRKTGLKSILPAVFSGIAGGRWRGKKPDFSIKNVINCIVNSPHSSGRNSVSIL